MNLSLIRTETIMAMEELCRIGQFAPQSLLVLGCSSSEVRGARIGTAGSADIGKVIVEAVQSVLEEQNLFLAVQGCEHINRTLVVEKEAAVLYGLEPVSVRPVLEAGGAAVTAAMELFREPVPVLSVQAHGGLDIGWTMIGMHLRRVAVPVRLEPNTIGNAAIMGAMTRPMLVGGPRSKY